MCGNQGIAAMKLRAVDTLHVSSVGPDNMAPGTEFDVSDDIGRQLVERGLASKVRGAAKAEEPAPKKKVEEPVRKRAAKPISRNSMKRRGK